MIATLAPSPRRDRCGDQPGCPCADNHHVVASGRLGVFPARWVDVFDQFLIERVVRGDEQTYGIGGIRHGSTHYTSDGKSGWRVSLRVAPPEKALEPGFTILRVLSPDKGS